MLDVRSLLPLELGSDEMLDVPSLLPLEFGSDEMLDVPSLLPLELGSDDMLDGSTAVSRVSMPFTMYRSSQPSLSKSKASADHAQRPIAARAATVASSK